MMPRPDSISARALAGGLLAILCAAAPISAAGDEQTEGQSQPGDVTVLQVACAIDGDEALMVKFVNVSGRDSKELTHLRNDRECGEVLAKLPKEANIRPFSIAAADVGDGSILFSVAGVTPRAGDAVPDFAVGTVVCTPDPNAGLLARNAALHVSSTDSAQVHATTEYEADSEGCADAAADTISDAIAFTNTGGAQAHRPIRLVTICTPEGCWIADLNTPFPDPDAVGPD